MKRFIIAAAITVLCFAAGIYCSFASQKKVNEIKAELYSASQALKSGNEKQAQKKLKAAAEKWNKNKLQLSAMTHRSLLSQLEIDLPSLPELAQSTGKENALDTLEKSLRSLEEVSESQRINFSNIL